MMFWNRKPKPKPKPKRWGGKFRVRRVERHNGKVEFWPEKPGYTFNGGKHWMLYTGGKSAAELREFYDQKCIEDFLDEEYGNTAARDAVVAE